MDLDKHKTDHQNEGKKRIRRTKAQLIADGYYNKQTAETKSEPKDNGHLFCSLSQSAEQVSDRYIQKAKEQGKENWEQDFRNDYEQGQKIYYIEVNELCHTKNLLELIVGTVYSKMMICWVDKGESHSIGIDDADKIFREEKEARKYYSKIKVREG
jgi:hypothetical protein